jgi:hypothetical protein
MPAVKKEESPEPPIATIAPAVSLNESSSSHQGRSLCNEEDARPLLPPPPRATKPYILGRQAHLASGTYNGSSPRKYKLTASGNSSSRVNVPPLPVVSRFPSRLCPSIATGRVNKTTTAATTTTLHTRILNLPKIKNLTQHLKQKSDAKKKTRSKMDDQAFAYDGDGTDDASFTGYPPMMVQGKLKLRQREGNAHMKQTKTKMES